MNLTISYIECFFSGRVQGVGFRYEVLSIAKGYDLTGYVKNVDDGKVELYIEGSNNEIEAFIDEIGNQLDTYISEIEKRYGSGMKRFNTFSILA